MVGHELTSCRHGHASKTCNLKKHQRRVFYHYKISLVFFGILLDTTVHNIICSDTMMVLSLHLYNISGVDYDDSVKP